MVLRIAWIFVLTVITASAQQDDRLWIMNAAGSPQDGRLAPGSIAQYSASVFELPAELIWEIPHLTLRQGNGPELTLDIVDGSPFSGTLYIPDTVSPGPATITAISPNYRLSTDIEITPAAPALYTVDLSRVLEAQLAPAASPVQLTSPARPGDIITLWGTGLGNATAGEIDALLGDQPVQVVYAGHSTQYRGLDQYNIAIPAAGRLPETCYANLTLILRGAATPVGYIPTANAATGPCRHPLNLTAAQLTTIDQGGQIPMASFNLSTSVSGAGDDGQFDFTQIERREDASASIWNAGAAEVAFSGTFTRPEPKACAINSSLGTMGFLGAGGGQPQADPPPSLGDKVRLEGAAQSWDLTRPPPERWFDSVTWSANLPVADPVRYFDQLPKSVWVPGMYTFSGPGDASLGAFRLETEIPGAIRLRNPETLRSIDRTRDLTLAWDTAMMRPEDALQIGLISRTDAAPVLVTCSVRAFDGTLTIPSSLLQQLPAGEVTPQRSPVLSLGYFRPRTTVQLPRRNADPVPAFIDWSSYATIPVTLR